MALVLKIPSANVGDIRDIGSRNPWRRARQPAPVFFLPGESHGQRSLEGYCPWGLTEYDTTKATQHTYMHGE